MYFPVAKIYIENFKIRFFTTKRTNHGTVLPETNIFIADLRFYDPRFRSVFEQRFNIINIVYKRVPNLTGSKWPKWDWYDWDAWTWVCINMTRRPKNFVCDFRFYTFETATRLEITIKKSGRLNHICGKDSVPVWVKADCIISVSLLHLASHSYGSQLGHFDAVILGTPI